MNFITKALVNIKVLPVNYYYCFNILKIIQILKGIDTGATIALSKSISQKETPTLPLSLSGSQFKNRFGADEFCSLIFF